MNKIWEFIKGLWRAVKGLFADPLADYGAEFHLKLGDLIAEKCKDKPSAKDKVAPLVDSFMEANRQMFVRAMDGDFSEGDKAVVKPMTKKFIKDILAL